MKKCANCGYIKSLNEFGITKIHKKPTKNCHDCVRLLWRKHSLNFRTNNREGMISIRTRYRQKNKDRILAYQRAWYASKKQPNQ